jgi:activator of HSP90 ATPase
MTANDNQATGSGLPARRQILIGAAVALGAIATSADGIAADAATPMVEAPTADADKGRTSLHQEAEFNVEPQRVYDALLDSKQFAEFSGLPATIDPDAGGTFTMFGGRIEGRNIELIPGQRIVQAWRPAYWPPGLYSIVKFELAKDGGKTKLVLDHTGFPEGKFGSLNSGWQEHYLKPLAKYLG